MNTVGSRIKYARENLLKASQKDLALMVGISQPSLAYVEADITKNPRKLDAFAKALGVSKEWILVGGEISNIASENTKEEPSIRDEVKDLKEEVEKLSLVVYKLLKNQ